MGIGPGQPSSSAALISHVSRSFPAEPLPSFHLEYRHFVDTSSLHPASDASLRKSTSLLTLSHTPTITYVATTPPRGKSQGNEQSSHAAITIPSGSTDSFTQLIGTKLQPLWTHRQSLVIENGTALSLKDAEWTVRIGDLKIPPRPNQAGSNLRGVLVEVTHLEDENDQKNPSTEDTRQEAKSRDVDKEDETLLRGFVDSVTEGSGVPAITSSETTRSLIRHTRHQEKEKSVTPPSADFDLADLYLDILRGPRG